MSIRCAFGAVVLTLLAMSHTQVTAVAQTTGMIEFFSGGKLQKGLPLIELAHEMVVIGRDGALHSLDPRESNLKIRPIQGPYQPISAAVMRNELRREFGAHFDVIATKNFLVVQPKGRGDRWPNMFEQSHRAFINFMSKRGVKIRNGRFPMVAVVFPDQRAMYAEFKRMDLDVSRVAGLYSANSNRVMTHDGGHLSSIAATVRHEAAHQSAFNSGVHSRVNDTPKWITEGIGQMFEPPAMTNQRGGSQLVDRVNRDSMHFINTNYHGRDDVRFTRDVMQLVSGDDMFDDEKRVSNGYAISWAMMFYLAEREPAVFAKVLSHTSRRPPFQAYTRGDRLRDFERIVGTDTFEFSKRVSWFLDSL